MDNRTNPMSILVVVFVCLFLKNHISLGADTIFANQSLSGDQTIVSANGIFELGFFKPGNSSNFYVGMWYKEGPQTVFWVANREKPVSNRFSSELKISKGNLVLFDESKMPIWSTDLNFTSSRLVQAVLLENGNLVLTDGSNLLEPLWESFDHPTNSWLPGIKFGLNKRTQKNQVITSWKNPEDPAPGIFSLQLNPRDNSYILLWNETKEYWNSGPWNGHIFSFVPEMRLNYIYNFSYINNENESYFTYSVYNTTKISIFVMDVSGQIKQLSQLPDKKWSLFWSQPRQQCEVYALCGANGCCNEESLPFCNCLMGFMPKNQSGWDLEDYSGGCIRKSQLQCKMNNLWKGERDRFGKMQSMLLPENKESVQVGSTEECESRCLDNCSCTAYAYVDNGCSVWIGEILDLQQLSADDSRGSTLYFRLAASEFQSPENRNGLAIGVVVGPAVVLAVVIGIMVFLIFRRRKKTARTRKIVGGSLMVFSYRDLHNATKNFSEKLGGGGFGSVFKGLLSDSTMIAVKKLESVGQGEKQFRTEVSTIGTIQHVNLVILHGFCSQGTKRLLVYDYMSNGSLDSHIFHENTAKILDWETRYKVALGTARGLVYLHEKCRDCIIHCDIKPENILLDAEFCPKVADFGLAKLVGREFSRVLTTMRGTRGYLAPEWIAGVAITTKADVYSYGMTLFELVSGKRNSEQYEDGKVKFFPTFASRLIVEGGNVISLLDPRLEGSADIEELERVCKVAIWCIQDNEAHRPSMGQVVQMLEGIIEVNLPPVPRSLQFYAETKESVVFFTESSSNKSS